MINVPMGSAENGLFLPIFCSFFMESCETQDCINVSQTEFTFYLVDEIIFVEAVRDLDEQWR